MKISVYLMSGFTTGVGGPVDDGAIFVLDVSSRKYQLQHSLVFRESKGNWKQKLKFQFMYYLRMQFERYGLYVHDYIIPLKDRQWYI